jgi:hypothetical protein
MGYHMNQRDAVFKIKAENVDKTLEAVKGLAETVDENGSGGACGGGKKTETWYSWVTTEVFANANTLQEAMSEWRWDIDTDDEGNVVWIDFMGEKIGDEEFLFNAIAPYVEDGSFIEMQGEDGAIWRWNFTGEECFSENARIVWE